MTLADYYNVLDLPVNSTIEEIKKAYRKKARLYHPDINPSADAKDKFISVTEAYEFLVANHEKFGYDDHSFEKAMEDWRKYRQVRSRKRATAYARTPYSTFKDTRFYKTTRIFDGTTIIFSLVISVMVLFYAIFGYIYILKHPIPGLEKPTVFAFLMFLLLGLFFLIISIIYLKAYQETSRKRKKKS